MKSLTVLMMVLAMACGPSKKNDKGGFAKSSPNPDTPTSETFEDQIFADLPQSSDAAPEPRSEPEEVVIIDTPEVEEEVPAEEEEEVAEETPPPAPANMPLTIDGLKRRGLGFNDAPQIMITVGDQMQMVEWPDDDETVTVDSICSAAGAKLAIKVVFDDEEYTPKDPQCFVGINEGDNSLHMGFEDDCDSMDYERIDNMIATFSCPQGKVEVIDLRLDAGIDMESWLNGL